MNNSEKVKELEKLLTEKQEEKRQVIADFKAKMILSKEASKRLANVTEEISRIEKELKRANK